MKLYLIALVSFFIFWLGFSPNAFGARKLLDRSLVTVNDEVILDSDLKSFQEKLKTPAYRELFGSVPESSFHDKKALLQLLIEEKVIDQQVKKLDLTASEMEIDRQIRVITEKNGITLDQLKAQLKRLGSSFTDYRTGIKRQLERRSLVDREIRPTLEVSDEQLKQYFQQTHGKKTSKEIRYHIAHIFVQGTNNDAKKKAAAIHAELKKSPDHFAKLVAESSDDASTAEHEGDLGVFAADALADIFKNIVPKIPEGQISTPIKSKAGFHIVKVLKSKPYGFDDLTREDKLHLRQEMGGTELEKKMASWLERKKSESYLKYAPNI